MIRGNKWFGRIVKPERNVPGFSPARVCLYS